MKGRYHALAKCERSFRAAKVLSRLCLSWVKLLFFCDAYSARWQRAAQLLLAKADVGAVSRQLELALLLLPVRVGRENFPKLKSTPRNRSGCPLWANSTKMVEAAGPCMFASCREPNPVGRASVANLARAASETHSLGFPTPLPADPQTR